MAPISGERRIEHVAEPVDDHRLPQLRKHARVDFGIIVRGARRRGERPARHQYDAAAELFDRGALLLVGADHVVDADVRPRRQVIGARPAEHDGAGDRGRRRDAAPDELERRRPIEAHAALGGVHRLGHRKAQPPQMLAVRDRALPIDRRLDPGIFVGQRIGDHMHGGKRPAVERPRGDRRKRTRGAGAVGLEPTRGCRQLQARHDQTFSSGISTQRRSAQLCCPSSASCTPLAPASRSHGNGSPCATCRRNSSHCARKAFS